MHTKRKFTRREKMSILDSIIGLTLAILAVCLLFTKNISEGLMFLILAIVWSNGAKLDEIQRKMKLQ